MKTVELHQAWEWTCDDCGRLNYCSAVTSELSPEDRQSLLDQIGMTENESVREYITGEFVLCPEVVTCTHCKAVFESENHGENPDEGDDDL